MTTPSALALHESAHAIVSFSFSSDIEIAVGPDTIEVLPQTPPTSAAQVIDAGLAGPFSDLLNKIKSKDGNPLAFLTRVRAAREAIRFAGYEVALKSDTAVHDLELLGPMLTQSVVEQSFERVAITLEAKADGWVSLAEKIDLMQDGERMILSRSAVH